MKYKVLVIDDDIAILRLIQNVLENKNFVVDTRTAIPEIAICHFIGYDLIICSNHIFNSQKFRRGYCIWYTVRCR